MQLEYHMERAGEARRGEARERKATNSVEIHIKFINDHKSRAEMISIRKCGVPFTRAPVFNDFHSRLFSILSS